MAAFCCAGWADADFGIQDVPHASECFMGVSQQERRADCASLGRILSQIRGDGFKVS
jgi:hypothetical protein